MALLVLPQYRPTLREEISGRRARVGLAAVGVLALVVLAFFVWAFLPHPKGVHYVHRSDPAFNLRYASAFRRLAPQRGEMLHIRRRVGGRTLDAFAVSRLTLPSYSGDVAGVLPVYAERVLAELRVAYPGLHLVEEGKARVNLVPGYSILFRVGSGRNRMFGREVLLPKPEAHPREGVRLALRTFKGTVVHNPRDLGVSGALRSPYRTFQFGTEQR
jgi:hypothetical protein